jgi:hypothetical protein
LRDVEGQGRKLNAAFIRERQDGRDIILVGEHVATRLEEWKNVKTEDHPLAAIQLGFGTDGKAISGEIFPAVKLTITPQGFPDIKN